MAARRRPNPGQDKAQARKASPPSSGGALFSTLFLLAILGGVGYAVVRIPVGERTLAEQASSWVQKQFRTRPRPVRPNAPKKQAVEPADPAEKATAKADNHDPAKAGAKAPAKPDPKPDARADARAAASPPADAKAMDRAIAKLAAMDPKGAKKPAAAAPAHPGFSSDEKKSLEKLMR
jgi:hypothetical protein